MKPNTPEDKRPVTHGELDPLMTAIKQEFNQLNENLEQFKNVVIDRFDRVPTTAELRQFKDAIIREFKVTAENIHQDVAGANKDEISSLKDADGKLDKRVKVVEERLGIPTPPAA